MLCEASRAIVSDHKTSYKLVGIDDPLTWIPTTWKFVCPGVILRYLGIPFNVGLSLIAMWDWCLERLHGKLLF
jgi:hypothetical protein